MAETPEDAASANRLDARSASLVDAYLDHLRIERRLSTNTLESYARDLTLLARFIASMRRRVLRLFAVKFCHVGRGLEVGG